MTICILGRQPAIGRAELEALYGADNITLIGDSCVLVHDDIEVDFDRLGGVVKGCDVKEELSAKTWQEVGRQLVTKIKMNTKQTPLVKISDKRKLTLGISAYNFDVKAKEVQQTGVIIKRKLRERNISIRIVPNVTPALSSAQVIHNRLATSPFKAEAVLVRVDSHTVLRCETIWVQNINQYTLRDRERPKRDSRVGMLPPKLAQIIINLSAGSHQPTTLLDPFCGTGVILQEAALMGYPIYGTDIEERMIRYSRDNINWLQDTHHIQAEAYYEVADATDHIWRQPVSVVACEGYLGTPFAIEPPEAALRDSIMTCNLIMKKFLRNIHGQLESGIRLCIAAPAWFVRGKLHHLPLLDDLENLGYNRIDFEHAKREDLIYHREDQVVGRELLVLIRK